MESTLKLESNILSALKVQVLGHLDSQILTHVTCRNVVNTPKFLKEPCTYYIKLPVALENRVESCSSVISMLTFNNDLNFNTHHNKENLI